MGKKKQLGSIMRATSTQPVITRYRDSNGKLVVTRTYRLSRGRLRIVAPPEVEIPKSRHELGKSGDDAEGNSGK